MKDKKLKILFFQRISVRVTLLILIILSTGIGVIIAYYVNSQNTAIIESREKAIHEESKVLYTSIKNNMLHGEATIVVNLFYDFSRIKGIGEIKLYRTNGVIAFSDNTSLLSVNKNLKEKKFTPKTAFSIKETIANTNFKKAVNTVNDVFVNEIDEVNKKIVIYKPLINQPKCSRCHGLDHVVRGVIKISSSINDVYKQTNFNMILSIIIYGTVVFILTISIIIFFHRFVIKRIFVIGKVVNCVGEGDFKTKISIFKMDEIGALSQQINDMIDGLSERFKLTKFVSKSALDHVKETDEISPGGEKKTMTVLFSNVKGFTNFFENKEPVEVMEIINKLMNLQAEIVQKYNGDIDKFAGHELMAVFEGEDMALRAVKAAEKIVRVIIDTFFESNKTLRVGIGINTGEMISGNMGTGNRMDKTVIGDSVNLGSRLCSMAGKNVIVLSEFSYELVKDMIIAKQHNSIKLKGKDKMVNIFTLKKTLQ